MRAGKGRGAGAREPAPAKARGPFGEPWHAWVGLGVGVLSVSAHSALSYGMSPLLKPITDDLAWTRTQYAQAMNFRLLLLMAAAPWAGMLVDRLGARMVLAAGALAMGLGTIGLSAVRTLGELYGLSLVIGPGQACIGSVAGSALVLRLFHRRRGLAIGVLNGGDNLITSSVHVAAAGLLGIVGWRGTLASLGVAYLALAGLILVALRAGEGVSASSERAAEEGRAEAASSRWTLQLRDLPWRDTRLWLLLSSYVLIYAFLTSIGIHFPAFQRDLGRGAEEAAWIYGASTLVGAVGSVVCGWFAERRSARAALSVVVTGLAASSVVLWSAAPLSVYLLWAVAYGVVNAGAVALLALVLNEIFGPAQIGRLMGIAMVFCMGGTIAGNLFSATIFDRLGSYFPVWETYSVLMLLTLVPVEILRRMPGVPPPSAPKGRGFAPG